MADIDLWADVRCPWCWIGSRRLREAVRRVRSKTRVRHRSYLLEPNGPRTPGRPMAAIAVEEWGMNTEQWRAKSALISAEGHREGLKINIDTALTFDSRPAHRLLKLADAQGINGHTSWDAVFDAHFRHNRDLGDHAVLRDVATTLGLADIDSLLSGTDFAEDVWADHHEAERNIRSVPTVVIGGQTLSGSRSTAELAEFITHAEATR